jgi:hypothetical protein
MKKFLVAPVLLLLTLGFLRADDATYDGLDTSLSNLARTSDAQSRSICPENPTGEKGNAAKAIHGNGEGAARELGQGWKISPCFTVKAHSTLTMADIDGSGQIQQIWMTPAPLDKTRFFIIRMYWDGETDPSVECPLADFFCTAWGQFKQINSLPVCVNPGSAFNCYWPMPFRKHAKITLENLDDSDMTIFYQINYTVTKVPADAAYFHAQFRRENPVKTKGLYTILDGVKGKGQYVGTYIAYGVHNTGWWGEGEAKFYIDGDTDFPTIASTGTEYFFCGSYDFDTNGQYTDFSSPYSGFSVIRPDGHYQSETRFNLYRWHIRDPVRFNSDLKVTIQDLGWQSGGRYLKQQGDMSSVAFWYQTEPHQKFPPLPTRDELELH